ENVPLAAFPALQGSHGAFHDIMHMDGAQAAREEGHHPGATRFPKHLCSTIAAAMRSKDRSRVDDDGIQTVRYAGQHHFLGLPLSGNIASPVAEAGSGMNDPVPVFCRPHHAARVGHVAEHALHVESVKRFGRSGCPAEYANRMTIFDHAAAKMRAEKTAPSRD